MILGIDEYLKEENKDQDIECIEFKKWYQRIYKKTGNQYKVCLELLSVPAEYTTFHNVFVFGHSLGYSDREVLKEFFDKEYVKVTIFYHEDSALKSLIANLVRIIGRDEVIRRVYGYQPTIYFEKQNENLPIKILAEKSQRKS